jgi:hypothetical protein
VWQLGKEGDSSKIENKNSVWILRQFYRNIITNLEQNVFNPFRFKMDQSRKWRKCNLQKTYFPNPQHKLPRNLIEIFLDNIEARYIG